MSFSSSATLAAQLVGFSNPLVIGVLAGPYTPSDSFSILLLKAQLLSARTCQGFLIFKFSWYYAIPITCITDLESSTSTEYTERWYNPSYRPYYAPTY